MAVCSTTRSCRHSRAAAEAVGGTARDWSSRSMARAVEAIGQAEAYAPKPGLHIVAPTNRRPYGFDWEDWGRLDAIEVLDLAQRDFGTDPRRTYLTGHSMGGHGTWHLGVTFPTGSPRSLPAPDGSACGLMLASDAPRLPDPVEQLMQRAISPSDTLALVA